MNFEWDENKNTINKKKNVPTIPTASSSIIRP